MSGNRNGAFKSGVFGRGKTIEKNTALRNRVIYQVYVRNHSPEGSFTALIADLDRIRDLGVDMIQLLPVHPVGEKNRKGALGSPYAVSDYRAINPELGTMEDFSRLVTAMHDRGIGCIMDIVYNHTSPDSVLAREHPSWFYRRPDGSPGNKIGEWWDVIDLDYGDPGSGLWEYQIQTLKTWAGIADGFRCDVAPLVPLEFWIRARKEVAKINPRCIWIAESVEPSFILENRARGFVCHADAEMFEAFDVCYDYDIFPLFENYLKGSASLAAYAQAIGSQEYIYPAEYVKLRNLENHDKNRAARGVRNDQALYNWTAFNYFQKGLTLIYAGQEAAADSRPSLFDKDPVNWNTGRDLSPWMRALYRIKGNPLLASSAYTVQALNEETLLGIHRGGPAFPGQILLGLFCLGGRGGVFSVPVPDGNYINLIDGSPVCAAGRSIQVRGAPVILEYREP
ncbi:MAG: hypothetical protein LBE02_03830 [Spirochaetaceae bacterium]|jgi:glycosidase|nr:hypothetical protein [Spirochaetaceae bacterium]